MAVYIVASFVLVAVVHASVVLVILGGGLAGALLFRPPEGGALL